MCNRIEKNKFSARFYRVIRWYRVYCPAIIGIACCFLILLCLIPGLSCAGAVNSEDGKGGISQKLSPKIKKFQERLNHLLSPISYTYTSAGKPDPFQPFLRNKPAPVMKKTRVKRIKTTRPEQCATPLECMDVGQLRLVAIVMEEDGENMAMAQDASGIGYVLTPGMSIGYRNGHVVKILSDRVIVKEEVENIRGEMAIMQRVLFLHPEEK